MQSRGGSGRFGRRRRRMIRRLCCYWSRWYGCERRRAWRRCGRTHADGRPAGPSVSTRVWATDALTPARRASKPSSRRAAAEMESKPLLEIVHAMLSRWLGCASVFMSSTVRNHVHHNKRLFLLNMIVYAYAHASTPGPRNSPPGGPRRRRHGGHVRPRGRAARLHAVGDQPADRRPRAPGRRQVVRSTRRSAAGRAHAARAPRCSTPPATC